MTLVDIPHGTRAGYIGTRARGTCRCQECRDANLAYLAGLVETAEHGNLSTYTMGCRCDLCRQCQSAYHQEYKHRSEYRRPQKEMLAWVDSLKDVPCVDCGESFPAECMDFDHVRGEKLFTISHLAKALKNRDRIAAEIEKCDVVCANCHRTRTRQRANA